MGYLNQINKPDDLKKLSVEELTLLSEEIRQEIISTVSKTGGHLASNLGSVELTIAMHYVFNNPEDKFIWDVSHQTYTHKLLTGRRERFSTLRQYDGLSGYALRTESKYDNYGAAHASTSISAALGFAQARDFSGSNHKVVAVIGDGAMTGGLAFEGLNNAGSSKKDLLVILNDNTWSISKNVGAISKYLTNIMTDEKFNKLRDEIWELTGRFKRRDIIRGTISKIEDSVKSLLVPGMLFDKFGFRYFGPIDGHDLPLMIETLENLKNIKGPILLHIGTVKGKGYDFAEGDAFKYHGVGKFDKVTGQASPSNGRPAYTKVFGSTMIELAAKNEKVVAITAAMAAGTGLVEFGKKYPDKFFDAGIAEAHAGCFACGLAAEGYKPYLAIYSTFLQRAYDQIIHDIGIQNLSIVLCMDRAGLVGDDGPTHHGVFDLAYLNTVPNMTVAAPKDGNELRAMLHYTADNDIDGAVAIRYPREAVPTDLIDEVKTIEWGKWELLTNQADVVLLAVGTMVTTALKAKELLAKDGLQVAVVNARFVKPLDSKFLKQIAKTSTAIITLEEGQLLGGFGSTVGSFLMSNSYTGKFKTLGIPDRFVTHGNKKLLLKEIGLDVDGVTTSIQELLPGQESSGGLFSRLRLKRNGVHNKTTATTDTIIPGKTE